MALDAAQSSLQTEILARKQQQTLRNMNQAYGCNLAQHCGMVMAAQCIISVAHEIWCSHDLCVSLVEKLSRRDPWRRAPRS